MTTQIPATVTIIDLPAGTTPTGVELIEAVQTASGVANSVSLTLSQVVGSLGGIPTGSVTGSLLASLGTGFSATWIVPSSFIAVGTGLARAGSTSLTLSLATVTGLSVLGVAGTSTAAPLAIVGTGAQVLRVNDAGTGLAFGALNLGSAAAVTGVLPGANFSAVNLSASGAGGVQGVLQAANMTAVNVNTTGAGGIQGQPKFQSATALPVAGSTAVGIQISSAANLGFYVGSGTPTFIAGTGSIYVNGGAATATSRLYINTNGSTTWATFTASA